MLWPRASASESGLGAWGRRSGWTGLLSALEAALDAATASAAFAPPAAAAPGVTGRVW